MNSDEKIFHNLLLLSLYKIRSFIIMCTCKWLKNSGAEETIAHFPYKKVTT